MISKKPINNYILPIESASAGPISLTLASIFFLCFVLRFLLELFLIYVCLQTVLKWALSLKRGQRYRHSFSKLDDMLNYVLK